MEFLGGVLSRHSCAAAQWLKVCLSSKLRPVRLGLNKGSWAPESQLGLGKYHGAKWNRTQDNRSPSDDKAAVFTHTQSLDNHASVRRCRRLAAEHECELHLGVQTGALHAKGTSVDTKVV